MVKVKEHNNNKRKKIKVNETIRFVSILAILLMVNVLSSFVNFRLDLTEEKRYTLASPTKELLKKLDDVVYIKVYLKGEFPAAFQKLSRSVKETLDEFKAIAGKKIEYEFINPSDFEDKKDREAVYKELFKKGLLPTDLSVKEEDGITNKIIWPCALVYYKEKEYPVNFLKTRIGLTPEESINSSIEALEYEFIHAIDMLMRDHLPSVAFIDGHGELDELQTADIYMQLSSSYAVSRVKLKEKINALTERIGKDTNITLKNKYDVIIIAKPDSLFSEKDKFLIDQFIMNGGKALWLIDGVQAEMDSLRNSDITVGFPKTNNLEDLLFKYGVRINNTLIQDLQAAPIPIVTGRFGNEAKTELFPWFYFPLLNPSGNHPVVNHLNPVKGEFVSTIDTVGDSHLKKTILLTSSKYSRFLKAPVRISLGILRLTPNPEIFNKSFLPAAVLVEGKFASNYSNRLIPIIELSREIGFKHESPQTKQIFVADGDIIRNEVKKGSREYFPLGYDRFTKQTYGNKEFIMNCIDYLCDDTGIMQVRSRKLKLRLIDKDRWKESEMFWKIFNTATPSFLVILGGLIFARLRKWKNTQKL